MEVTASNEVLIMCACGCGGTITDRDGRGRPRRFIHRHNILIGRLNRVYLATKPTRSYIAAAEQAIGRPLPNGAHVHHVDGDRYNNANANLVICEDESYHKLLHVRTRIVKAGGNPNTQRICWKCQRLVNLSDRPYIRKSALCRPCKWAINNARASRRLAERKAAEASC